MPPLHQPRALQKMLQNRNRYLRLLSETLPEYSLQKCSYLLTANSSRTQFNQKIGIDKHIDSATSVENNPKITMPLHNISVNKSHQESNSKNANNSSNSSNMIGALTNTRRNVLHSYCKVLDINQKWISSVNTIMQETCRGIIPDAQIANNDLFACALIHPSFISAEKIREKEKRLRLREIIAMPAELITSGSSSVQLLNELAKTHNAIVERRLQRAADDAFNSSTNNIEDKELHENSNLGKRANNETNSNEKNENGGNSTDESCESRQHQQKYKWHPNKYEHVHNDKMRRTEHYAKASVITTQDLVELLSLIHLEDYILFDANAFGLQTTNRSHGANHIPQEVVVSAAIAICGAVNLFGGINSIAAFLDQVFGINKHKN